MRAPLIPTTANPFLRPHFVALADAVDSARNARRLLSPESTTPEPEASARAIWLIDEAISHLVKARSTIEQGVKSDV